MGPPRLADCYVVRTKSILDSIPLWSRHATCHVVGDLFADAIWDDAELASNQHPITTGIPNAELASNQSAKKEIPNAELASSQTVKKGIPNAELAFIGEGNVVIGLLPGSKVSR